MSVTRRSFLSRASALAVLKSLPAAAQQAMQEMGHMQTVPPTSHPQNNAGTVPANGKPVPQLHALELAPFVDPLPLPARLHAGPHQTLHIPMREIHASLHRDLPGTRQWTYGSGPIAPLIEARSGHPLRIEWINQLPTQHFLPIDYSLHGCGRDIPEVRACAHLHGGRTPPADDGYPEDWFTSGHSRRCRYPLEQDATALWYHDHAMGLNRLNLYAGLFGMLLLRDAAEDALGLPSGAQEIPLILCDRNLTRDAQLLYPVSGDPAHPWVSEFAGDAIVINGKIRPFVELEPKLYRFRLLNAANSRFYGLSLTERKPFYKIGGDQGLLSAPVSLTYLTVAPAERADLLIDLSPYAGKRIHLRTGALDILELRVASSTGQQPQLERKARAAHATPARAAVPAEPKASLSISINPSIPTTLRPVELLHERDAVKTRSITLNEYQDPVGNSMVMLLNRKHWHEPVTETPRLNTTEVWEFINLTEDTHPMHLHLVRFQILDRRPFDTFDYLMHKNLRFTAPAASPDPHELGWKDVVQCPAGTVTRIIARFEGYTGKYLYHCHILEHEANDMMRPFEVIA